MGIVSKTALAIVMLASFGCDAADARLLGGVDAGTYGDTKYEEIHDIELKTFPARMQHPYEVVVRNTPFGRMVTCTLYDSAGKIISTKMNNSGKGQTHIYFTDKTLKASVRCYYVSVERLTRP